MRLYGLLIIAVTFLISSCGGGSDLPSLGGQGGSGGSDPTPVQPATVTLMANPVSISVNGSSSITATVKDSDGANVPDGTIVLFSSSSTGLGTINRQTTTANGVAIATLNALSTAGTVTITATAGNVTNNVDVEITAQDLGGIEFISAIPSVIGISGSGQTETSAIKFLVRDTNGNLATDGVQVSFSIEGPNGGEFLTQTSAPTSGGNGEVTNNLNSGFVAGTVFIKATVIIDGSPKSSSAAPISIGGGVPSSTHFSLATSILNLAGLAFINEQSEISAFVGDRFANYNVLEGTSISFYTEAGAINRSALTDSIGQSLVTFRTQAPIPVNVAETAAEGTLRARMLSTYGISTTSHPRDGWNTILGTVIGEEAFEDANANGIFDPTENFTDLGEPFFDKNNDGCRNTGTQAICEPPTGTIASTDPFEEFIDANGNSVFDIANACWDGPRPNPSYTCSGRQESKMIYDTVTTMFTGGPVNFAVVPSTFAIADGGALSFSVVIGDTNLNFPIAGTTIAVSSSAGKLTASPPSPVSDTVSSGPIEFSFTLSDDDPGDSEPVADPAIITVDVTWKGTKFSRSASGSVQ